MPYRTKHINFEIESAGMAGWMVKVTRGNELAYTNIISKHGSAISCGHRIKDKMIEMERMATKYDIDLDKPPLCPKCDNFMGLRISGSTGKPFWGCSMYPDCKGTVNINA